MKRIDVLIIYEHKTRELENCALLAAELKNRGYSVEILYMYSMPIRWKLEAKVIITPHLYDENQLAFFILNKTLSNKNVIDLQYEQVLSEAEEDGIHNPSGQAKFAHHIAWGTAQTQRYLKHGINSNNIHEVGCISMDLFRPEFRDYFISREKLSKQHGIESDKEWVLFISSFSYAHRDKKEIEQLSKLNPDAEDFADISEKSYQEIIKWFETALIKYPQKVFIYRKHPAELNDESLQKLEKKYSNFKCIDSYSMRQWTVVVDRIYTWFSTSLVDVYFAGKNCYILRPCNIPQKMEVSLMYGGDFIKSNEKFLESLVDENVKFPISSSKIEYYYANSKNGKMSFQKTADLCENIISDKYSNVNYTLSKPSYNLYFCIKYVYDYLMYEYGLRVKTPKCIISFLKAFPFLRKTASKLDSFNRDLYGTKKLLLEYQDRFSQIIESWKNEAN